MLVVLIIMSYIYDPGAHHRGSVRCGAFSSVAIIPLRAKACNILIVKYRSLLTII